MNDCRLSPKSLITAGAWLSALALLLPPAAASDAPSPPVAKAVDYMIVITGGEILAGAYPDAHTCFLTRTLHPLGLQCVGSMTVDDKPADIKEALRFARGKAKLIVVTGGLGPTENDVTRQSLAEFSGVALREHPDVLTEMERRFNMPRDRLRPGLRRQTQVPVGGSYLKNPTGTAVGIVFELGEAVIVALPGPPRELQPMVRNELVPYLSRRFGTRLPGCLLTLRLVGLGQSQISQTLKDHVRMAPDVAVYSQFEGSRVDYTFSLPDDTPQGRARLAELKQQILKQLADYIYADDDTSLEEHVARLLTARKATVALAEAGSGGSLAAGLSGAEGARHVLAGAYVAGTEEALRRLLRVPDQKWSAPGPGSSKVQLLAVAAAEATGSPWAIAVGDPQRDASGGRYVEVVFRQPEGRTDSVRLGLRGTGELNRSTLATQLLDQLRRRLR